MESGVTEMLEKFKNIKLIEKSAFSWNEPSTTSQYEYVLHIDSQNLSQDEDPLLAITRSDFTIYIQSRCRLAPKCTIKGHTSSVTGVRFSRADFNILFSSSLDQTVRAWDVRAPQKAIQILTDDAHPDIGFTCCDACRDGTSLCAGTECCANPADEGSYIVIWDRRKGKILRTYNESHNEEITQVKFHGGERNRLLSASTDGLLCVHDTSQFDEDESLQLTLNVLSPIAEAGWCRDSQFVYCTTDDDTFHMWDITHDGDVVCELTDIKEQLTSQELPVDYLVDLLAVGTTYQPVLLVGSNTGHLQVVTTEKDGRSVRSLATLQGGHSDIVRCVSTHQPTGDMVTGGEDSLVCLWSAAAVPSHSNPRSRYKHRKMKSRPTYKSAPY